MSQSNNVMSFEDALKTLNSLSQTNLAKEYWVPSLKTNIKLKEINAEQQKKLLSSALENTLVAEKIHFEQFIYKVLKENNLTDAIEVNNLTTIDRVFLSLCLRHQISPQLNVRFEDNLGNEYRENVELTPLIENIKNYNHPDTEEIFFNKDSLNVKVVIGVPKLGLDNFYYQNVSFLKNTKNINNEQLLNNIIIEGFISETSKYIKNIFLDDQDLSYNSWNLNQKTFFVEKMPLFMVQNIFDKMTLWKSSVESYLKVVSSRGDEAVIEINSSSFLN